MGPIDRVRRASVRGRVAVIEGDTQVTFRELHERACQLADALLARGSVGIPLFDTEPEIRHLDEVVPNGERGEIWVRGRQLTEGVPAPDRGDRRPVRRRLAQHRRSWLL